MFAKFRIISIVYGKCKFTMQWKNGVIREYNWQDFDILAWLKGWNRSTSFAAHDNTIFVPIAFISLTDPF